MKFYICYGKKRCLKFWLPNSIIKCKWLIKLIFKKNEKTKDIDWKILSDVLKDTYKALKQSIKANGHFVLLEAYSADGSAVKIKV